MRTAAAVAVAATALLAAGCGTKSVSKGDIEAQIKDQLAKRGYTAPVKSVSCPDDLEAKVGKKEACTLTYKSGHQFEVRARVVSVSGKTAHLDYTVTKRLK